MSEVIVSKFGGTSNSDAEAVAQCMELSRDSQVMVTSAPGKLNSLQLHGMSVPLGVPAEFFSKKVTDQLLIAHDFHMDTGEIPRHVLDSITARYRAIVEGLGISALQTDWLRDIAPRVETAAQSGQDYASMLGERLQSEVYRATGRELLDPSRAGTPILPRKPDAWKGWLQGAVEQGGQYVLPGNTWFDGNRLHTFSRGGSDISGALAAYAMSADAYRNMTDTPAQSADPRLVADPSRRRTITHLTYQEGRDLGRNGTGLLHPEAIIPLMGTGIPTEIRNTFDPTGQHTLYSDEVDHPERTGEVMAISLIPEVTVVTVHEPGMSESKGRIAALSARVAESGVSIIDIVGFGSDTELFIIEGKDREKVEASLHEETNSHGTVTGEDCSLVTLVGYQLKRRAFDIRVELSLNAGLGKEHWQSGSYWMEGEHSLRFTVGRDLAKEVVDKAHRCLLER